MLYRMFGIPARYVVGYEIPASLFSVQSNGTYTATIQGDNVQAEIYVPGIGWTPKDMTPGVIGTYEEVGPGGEKIEASVEERPEQEGEGQPTEPTAEETDTAPTEPGGTVLGDYSVAQIVTVILYLGIGCLTAAGIGWFLSRLCKALGYAPFRADAWNRKMIDSFQAFYSRMSRLGLPKSVSRQSEAFLTFCEKELGRRSPEAVHLVRPMVERLYQVCFGGERATAADVSAMRRLVRASYRKKRSANRHQERNKISQCPDAGRGCVHEDTVEK